MFIPNLRLIFPYYNGYSFSSKNGEIWKLYEESFFYLFRVFNVSVVTVEHSLSEIRSSSELPVLEAIQKDIGDVYTYGFQPLFIPENVTTTGSIESTHECFMISFPILKAKSVSVDGLKFIWHNSDYETIFALSISFLAILAISVFTRRSSESMLRIYWRMFWTILANQQTIRTSTKMNQILWLSMIMILFLVESVTRAYMNTDQVSEYEFDRIENLEDVYHKRLIPILEDYSGCTQLIPSQTETIKNYLDENRYPRKRDKYLGVDEIFTPQFRDFSMHRIAMLIWDGRWIQIQRQTCYMHPEILLKHPNYRSRKPLLYQINSIVVNKRLSSRIRTALNRDAATMVEGGLFGRKGFLATQRRDNLPADINCLNKKLVERKTEHSPLQFSFIRSVLLTCGIAFGVALFIFAIEFSMKLKKRSLKKKS